MNTDLPAPAAEMPTPLSREQRAALVKISVALLVCFTLLGSALTFDLQRSYQKILADTAYRALQRSQIIGQSFRTEVLAADYVLRDVLGRFQEDDLVFPDPDPAHAQRLTQLLKEKGDTVPDFFSMVVFNRDCVFAVTATGKNTGVQSKPELCAARKAHRGTGPLATYVSGKDSASGRSVLVLSRNLLSPNGEFLGGILGVIDLESAQRRFDSLSMESGDSVTLLDETQVMLARRPLLADSIEKQVAQPMIPATLASQEPVAGNALQWDADGTERLFGFSKIEGFPFIVAYGFNKANAMEGWRQRAWELGVGFFTLLVLAVVAARSYWVTLRQRDELVASKVALQELATRDPLTGLYNRRFLDAALPRECARSEREGQPMAVIMLDLDYFKKVNDQHGHAAGDEVLKALAALLQRGARESDLICRYGGEEFVAVMPNMSAEQALDRAEAWRRQLEEQTLEYGDFKIRATLSAGIAVFPAHGTVPDQILNQADAMLYQSKHSGRNRISVASAA